MLAVALVTRDIDLVIAREIVSTIPSVFGQLLHLASLRNLYTGRYEHPVLSADFGAELTDRELGRCHKQVFDDWLAYPVAHQLRDLEEFLASIPCDRRLLLKTWLHWEPYRIFVPESTADCEREIYLGELRIVLALLRENLPADNSSCTESGAGDRRVVLTLRRIADGLGDGGVSLRNIAAQCGLSASRLGRLFKAQIGVNFHQYLMAHRMRKAAALLRSTTLSVKQVTAAVGYSDSSNFVHDFRRFFSVTPREYRKCSPSETREE
jgi:AraC-like DNA-binding protein